MSGNTVTRSQLSEAVYQEVGLSRNESADLVEAVLEEISGALIRGEPMKKYVKKFALFDNIDSENEFMKKTITLTRFSKSAFGDNNEMLMRWNELAKNDASSSDQE